jgi:HTH-type transcriptional regulator / antitoxin HigA
MRKIAGPRIKDEYFDLVKTYPLKNVHNEKQHAQAVRMLTLLDGREEPLSEGAQEYADALATLIKEYEHAQGSRVLPKMTGISLVRHLLAEHRLTQKEFGRLIDVSESAASMILAGQRDLTKSHILRLAEHFGLPPSAFL